MVDKNRNYTQADMLEKIPNHASRHWKRIQLHTSTSVGKESKPQKTKGHTEEESKHKTTVANNFMK
jgi:hypothetical protein